MSDKAVGGGCAGCSGLLFLMFLLFVFWTIFFGIQTPWGIFHVDFFPPAIRLEIQKEQPYGTSWRRSRNYDDEKKVRTSNDDAVENWAADKRAIGT